MSSGRIPFFGAGMGVIYGRGHPKIFKSAPSFAFLWVLMLSMFPKRLSNASTYRSSMREGQAVLSLLFITVFPEPDTEECSPCVWWMKEWMNERNLSSETWLLSKVRHPWCLAPPLQAFPVACLGLSWKMIFHTRCPHYNIIPQSEALWPPWRPVFNVMKGDLMELRRTKQKADSHFRKAEQCPSKGKKRKKEKGGKNPTPSPRRQWNKRTFWSPP